MSKVEAKLVTQTKKQPLLYDNAESPFETQTTQLTIEKVTKI